MSHARAATEIEKLRRFFRLLPSTPNVLDAWQRIVLALGITGKQTHDAHLVAVMDVYSVTSILTFNTGHFGRFPGIAVPAMAIPVCAIHSIAAVYDFHVSAILPSPAGCSGFPKTLT